MFQPTVKLEFVRHYCPPGRGWHVFVDIDPSEEGRTGGERTNDIAREHQRLMQSDCQAAREQLERLGAQVCGSRAQWCRQHQLPRIVGVRDIIALHSASRVYVVVEVEGESSGQPEQKLYKAIGQNRRSCERDRA